MNLLSQRLFCVKCGKGNHLEWINIVFMSFVKKSLSFIIISAPMFNKIAIRKIIWCTSGKKSKPFRMDLYCLYEFCEKSLSFIIISLGSDSLIILQEAEMSCVAQARKKQSHYL